MGTGRAGDALLAGVVAGTLAGMLLAGRRVRRGRGIVVAAVVACVAAAGVFVPLPRLGPHQQVVAARPADPPETDPLSRLPRWNSSPAAPVLHARFAGPPGQAGRLWPLLAYDGYRADSGWQASPALTALPAAGGGTRVEVVLAHPERLVPHPFGVRTAHPAGTRYDPRSEALRTSGARTAYSLVVDTAPRAPGGRPLAAEPSTGCAGPELRSLLGRVHRNAPLADQLAELQQVVAGTGSADPAGPAEDGCAGVTAALREGHGTSDQYATAFALAARMLGASSRVVAGFAPQREVSVDGGLDVLGGDAVAWPQIACEGGVWVDYWPLPGRTVSGGVLASPGPAATTEAARPPAHRGTAGSGRAVWPLALAAGAVLLLSAVASGLVVLRDRRADRIAERRAAAARWAALDPRQRILVLWQRSLRDGGVAASRSTTARDVAAATDLPPLRELALLVDRTLYVPAAEAGTEEAERAARLAAAVRAGPGPGDESGAGRGRAGRGPLSRRRPPC
ncbi:transglutaminase-like domain-containing protein [Streptomyces sp. NPDC049040]|uniref:transglutaminase-like domain-containing protein n=1 Tax=Streptomyces sp. NPDC049040 TaxID=3365593 RepID=UPI003710B7B6